MTEQQMLELVRSLTRANRWEVDRHHGQMRMQQRCASFADVEHALLSATQCQVQDNGRWKLVSCDLDGASASEEESSMKCIHCGKADLIQGAVPHAVTVAGVEFATELPGRRCPKCGSSTVNGPAAVRFDLLVAAELVKRGRRSGDSFKFMRKALGMKAIEIAEAFNVAPETVSRWENGQREVDWPEFMVLGFLVDDKLAGRTTTLSRLKELAEPAQETGRIMIPFHAG